MSNMPPQPDPDQCALDKNGQLKDIKYIAFFHSPSDNSPIPLPPVDGETGTSMDNGGMSHIPSHVQLLTCCILAQLTRPQQNKNSGIQEILAAEHLNEWGDLDKKHCQPKQCLNLKRKAKQIKVVDGLSDINPEDDNNGKYQTDTADSISKSEANNTSDDDISNGEVSVRSPIIFAFPLISIWF